MTPPAHSHGLIQRHGNLPESDLAAVRLDLLILPLQPHLVVCVPHRSQRVGERGN
jgi:hypothetical protein